MQYESRYRRRAMLLMVVIGVAVIAVLRISSAAGTANGPAPQQDIIRLDNRITQLEQRLFSIDTSLRTLEQQSRMNNAASRGNSQDDIALLRAEIQALQRRLADDECALAKLDERTLSPVARRRSGAAGDPCRVNTDTPLRLPERSR